MSDEQPAPDAGNTEDMSTLTEPLDPADDAYRRIALVNVEPPADSPPASDLDR